MVLKILFSVAKIYFLFLFSELFTHFKFYIFTFLFASVVSVPVRPHFGRLPQSMKKMKSNAFHL